MATYETIFITPPNLAEDVERATVETMAQVVTTGGGTIAAQDRMGRRRLAYPIKKFEDGVYIRLLYDAEGGRPEGDGTAVPALREGAALPDRPPRGATGPSGRSRKRSRGQAPSRREVARRRPPQEAQEKEAREAKAKEEAEKKAAAAPRLRKLPRLPELTKLPRPPRLSMPLRLRRGR